MENVHGIVDEGSHPHVFNVTQKLVTQHCVSDEIMNVKTMDF